MNTGRALLRILVVLAMCAAFEPGAWAQDSAARRGFSIRIDAPKSQEVVFGKTTIAASVRIEQAELVERVEFLIGDRVIFVDREAPYEAVFDFGEESKSWIVRAVAHHKEGVTVSDMIITRKVALFYSEEVNRIVLWATVTDKTGAFVEQLTKDDFAVFEDGKEQPILELYAEERPVTLAILIDTSLSMKDGMKDVHEAAGSFVESLREHDRALVIAFDDRVFLIEDLTADKHALKEAITSTEALGATALYDAMHAAYRKLRPVQGRKAIVLLSDGEDTSSQFGFERVLEEAKAESVIVYAIGIGSGFLSGTRRDVLKEFSEATGGRAFFVNKASELAETYQKISDELRKQYYLTFATAIKTWDGRFVPIEVRSRDERHKVRARKGYFAVRPK